MKEIAKLLCFIFFLSQQSSFSQWFLQNSGVMINLNSVYFLNVNVGLAAGDEGVILKTTNGGNDWFQLTSGTTNNLNTLYFVNSDTGWAAGDNAVIIKTTNGGLTWENQTSNPPYGNISSIYFTSPGSGWATGYIEYSPGNFDSYISKTLNGGITWEDNYNIMDEKMFDIMFPDNLNGWDVGTAIYVTTDGGSNWYGSGTGIEFHSVYFVDQFTGWIAGTDYINNKGIVIHTTDGGITWYPPVNFPSISLNSLFFTNLSTASIIDSGVCLSNNIPDCISIIESFIPPLLKAITGVPHDSASTTIIPKSSSAAKTNAFAFCIYSFSFSSG